MKRLLLAVGLALLGLALWGMGLASKEVSAEPQPPSDLGEEDTGAVRLVSQDEEGLVLELVAPRPRFLERGACREVSLAGYGDLAVAGEDTYELPVKGAMVGVPATGRVRLALLDADPAYLPAGVPLCEVPPRAVELPFADPALPPLDRSPGEAAPSAPVELVSTGFVRSQRVAQLRFTPVLYDEATGRLRYYERLRVRLEFSPPRSTASSSAFVDEGDFEDLLRESLLNYEGARGWRRASSPAPSVNRRALPQGVVNPAYRLYVEETGLYALTYDDLLAMGVPVDTEPIDPRYFHVYNQGSEVAILVEGEGDGFFDPGDAVVFYAEALETRYTDENVYWFTWDSFQGWRMDEVSGKPAGSLPVAPHFKTTAHVEENHEYRMSHPSGEDDRWYWEYLIRGSIPVGEYPVDLPRVASGTLTATLRGLFKGYAANPSHHSRVYLNGNLVHEDDAWYDEEELAFEVDVPHAYVLTGTNTISVEVDSGGTSDIFFVNHFELDYYATYGAVNDEALFDGDEAGGWEYRVGGFTTETLELYNVTDPQAPQQVVDTLITTGSGGYALTFQETATAEQRFAALSRAQRRTPARIVRDDASNLTGAENGADYVIITHSDFYTEVEVLASYRASQGLRVALVDLQDVYDEFNYGIPDPEAIRSFLAHAYAEWEAPAPTYVLLVGDGTYDFKDYEGSGEVVYMPPYLADVDPWVGETAADNRFVCVSGSDLLPDMHLGRFPVKTAAEAQAMVDKVLDYESQPVTPGWSDQVLFIADDADSAGDFAALSDVIADGYVPAPYATHKVYYGLEPYTTATAAKTAVRTEINAGRLIVNFIGHSYVHYWAQIGPTGRDFLLHRNWLPQLTNEHRLPLFVPMTCWEGYYIFPPWNGTQNASSVSESAVRQAATGAIATFSPTGLGVAEGHDFLNKGLFEAIFYDGVAEVGPATTRAKLYLYANTAGHRELLDTYVLFGDPALRLNVLETDLSLDLRAGPWGPVRPGDTVTYTLAYTNAGPATAHNVVISHPLSSALLTPTVTSTGAAITARADGNLVWDVAELLAGEGGSVTVTAVAGPAVPQIFTTTATLASTAIETDTTNNAATVALGWPVSIAASGSDAHLGWDALDGATGYKLYRDTAPYFTPSVTNLLATQAGRTYVDPGALGDPATNYFYAVTALDGSGAESPHSAYLGEFDFALEPGDASGGKYNVVALPVDATGALPSASALADHVGPSVEQVLRWHPASQTYEFWLPAIGFGTDFPLAVGESYWLEVSSAAPSAVSFVGQVPWPGAVSFDLVTGTTRCAHNDISLPLDATTVVSASGLSDAVGGVEQALEWDAASQTFDYWLPEISFGTDFPLRPGYPYHLCLKTDAPPSWPR